MDGFEVFDRVHSRIVKTPLVTIQVRGYMSLNLAAFEALKYPKAVELMYNRKEMIIGIKKIDPTAVHAVFVRKQASSPSYLVSGTSFANLFDIDISVARRYKAELNNGILTVDLKQPGAIATGPNTKENIEKRRNAPASQGALFQSDEDILAGAHPSEQVTTHAAKEEPPSQEVQQLKEALLDALTQLDESNDPHDLEALKAELARITGKKQQP